MFYFYIVGMMMGYTLQNVFLVKYARTMDALSLGFYRNISLLFTMFPILLFGARRGDIGSAMQYWPLLLIIGLAGGLFLTFIYRSYTFVPVGLASTISKSMIIIMTSMTGWLWLGDMFSVQVIGLMTLITVTTIALSLCKHSLPHLDSRFSRGILFVALAAPMQTVVLQLTALLTRTENPLVIAYFLECSIVFGCLFVLAIRYTVDRRVLQRISLRQFLDITLRSSPTIAGTVLFALAARLGPVGIISAISTAELAFISLLSWKFYNDSLSRLQWMLMICIMIEIVAFKLVLSS